MTAAKKDFPELKTVQSQVLQQTLKRLEVAFVAMWERNHGFPRFKKHGRMRSFVFPQMEGERLKPGMINLPKIGLVKFRQSRDIPDGGVIKQARVVKRVSQMVYDVNRPMECNPTTADAARGSSRN